MKARKPKTTKPTNPQVAINNGLDTRLELALAIFTLLPFETDGREEGGDVGAIFGKEEGTPVG